MFNNNYSFDREVNVRGIHNVADAHTINIFAQLYKNSNGRTDFHELLHLFGLIDRYNETYDDCLRTIFAGFVDHEGYENTIMGTGLGGFSEEQKSFLFKSAIKAKGKTYISETKEVSIKWLGTGIFETNGGLKHV